MISCFRSSPRTQTRAPFLSPRYLLRCAAAVAVSFALAHVAGLREFTSVLNGTIGSTSVSWETAALLGLLYIGLYLAFVLAVPVLMLAAGILAVTGAGQAFRQAGGNDGANPSPPLMREAGGTAQSCEPEETKSNS